MPTAFTPEAIASIIDAYGRAFQSISTGPAGPRRNCSCARPNQPISVASAAAPAASSGSTAIRRARELTPSGSGQRPTSSCWNSAWIEPSRPATKL